MKFEYIVKYENMSTSLYKVTVQQMFSPFTAVQTVRSYNLQLKKYFILSIYFHLIIICNMYEYR